MKVIKEIITTVDGKDLRIKFGMPDTEEEKIAMFKLRYKAYKRKNLIEPNKEEIDIDNHDKDGACVYFIARVDNKIIGSARIIKEEYLPTEKEYFNFKEPESISKISRKNRTEIGRLVSTNYGTPPIIPRHLILLMLFYCMTDYAERNGILAGYGTFKMYVYKKMNSIAFPIIKIKNCILIFNTNSTDPFRNFFKDKKVVPVYFFTRDVKKYLEKIFLNSFLFKMTGDGAFRCIGENRLKIYLIKLFIFSKLGL